MHVWDPATIDTRMESRAVTFENPTGGRGQGGTAANGRKGAPNRLIAAGETVVLADLEGPGTIRHIWFTVPPALPEQLRALTIEVFYDGAGEPSISAPILDFFGLPHGRRAEIYSALLSVNEGRGFNAYFPMPFERGVRVEFANRSEKSTVLYYQIDFTLEAGRDTSPSFLHASFRRQNPTTLLDDFVIVDGLAGPGRFLGCAVGVRVLDDGPWYGEGEVKIYLDGDTSHPTICGTGLEDYIGSAWGVGRHLAPYAGTPLDIRPPGPDGRPAGVPELMTFYRFHLLDPVMYADDLRVTIQQLGISAATGHLAERVDDYCATAWVYCRTAQPVPRVDIAAAVADLQRRPYEAADPLESLLIPSTEAENAEAENAEAAEAGPVRGRLRWRSHAVTATLAFPAQAPAPRRYTDRSLDRIAFPLGGLGAGSVNLTGNGALAGWSVRNTPDVFCELPVVALLQLDGHPRRALQGPVARWRAHHPWGPAYRGSGSGGFAVDYGLRRFRSATFTGRFPFAHVALDGAGLPVSADLTAWSPFVPSDADASSLPVAILEYRLANHSEASVRGELGFHARNMLDPSGDGNGCTVESRPDGYVLRHRPEGEPWRDVSIRFACADTYSVDADWPVDPVFQWAAYRTVPTRFQDKQVRDHREHPGHLSPGGSLFVPVDLAPGAEQVIVVRISWYAPHSDLRTGMRSAGSRERFEAGAHRPWYSGQFGDVDEVDASLSARLRELRRRTEAFADSLWASTMPEPVLDAVAANLSILRSPTVLRDVEGRMWAWEGSNDDCGSCAGTCTHVWNYAQAVAHLFPSLERGLREVELELDTDERGHQVFRSQIPYRPNDHDFHAAIDGQLGGLMKLHREWRISGDDAWLRRLWPLAKRSFSYCCKEWDTDGDGMIEAPHHNTFDIEFHEAEPMAQSFYIGACAAMAVMAEAMGEDPAPYRLLEKAAADGLALLWNGKWFGQRRVDPGSYVPVGGDARFAEQHRLREVLEREGPAFQYWDGVMTEATCGLWLADQCGLVPEQPAELVGGHLDAVVRHNLRDDLTDHECTQRPGYAFGDDGGLVICSWPDGDEPTLPFPYSDEVWTGCEYHVAALLTRHGKVDDALRVVTLARARYDGERRNPYNEQECGHWYARALASYGLLQAFTGVQLSPGHGVTADPKLRGDFRSFVAWDGGFGLAISDGDALRIHVADGRLPS